MQLTWDKTKETPANVMDGAMAEKGVKPLVKCITGTAGIASMLFAYQTTCMLMVEQSSFIHSNVLPLPYCDTDIQDLVVNVIVCFYSRP